MIKKVDIEQIQLVVKVTTRDGELQEFSFNSRIEAAKFFNAEQEVKQAFDIGISPPEIKNGKLRDRIKWAYHIEDWDGLVLPDIEVGISSTFSKHFVFTAPEFMSSGVRADLFKGSVEECKAFGQEWVDENLEDIIKSYLSKEPNLHIPPKCENWRYEKIIQELNTKERQSLK